MTGEGIAKRREARLHLCKKIPVFPQNAVYVMSNIKWTPLREATEQS